jgi:hypothetical protein
MNAFPHDLKLSKKELKAFRRDGVVCLRGVLSKAEITALRTDVSTQMAGLKHSQTAYDLDDLARQVWAGRNGTGDSKIDVGAADRFDISDLQMILDYDEGARPIREGRAGSPAQGGEGENGMFFYDAAGWRFHEGIRSAALDSALPSLCTQLLESKHLNFWEDTTFVKGPGTTQQTSFHQDYGYFQISGRKCCIVWIPLDIVTEETGQMEYVRGSHHWEEAFAPNILISQSSHPLSPFEPLPDVEGNRDKYDIISFDVEPGDVIIHHVMTVHGSRGNLSRNQVRRALSFRYCGDDITYCDRPGAMVQPYLLDKPAEGAPLYSKDYPLVWPRPYPDAKLSPVFEEEDLKGKLTPISTFTQSASPDTWTLRTLSSEGAVV